MSTSTYVSKYVLDVLTISKDKTILSLFYTKEKGKDKGTTRIVSPSEIWITEVSVCLTCARNHLERISMYPTIYFTTCRFNVSKRGHRDILVAAFVIYHFVYSTALYYNRNVCFSFFASIIFSVLPSTYQYDSNVS